MARIGTRQNRTRSPDLSGKARSPSGFATTGRGSGSTKRSKLFGSRIGTTAFASRRAVWEKARGTIAPAAAIADWRRNLRRVVKRSVSIPVDSNGVLRHAALPLVPRLHFRLYVFGTRLGLPRMQPVKTQVCFSIRRRRVVWLTSIFFRSRRAPTDDQSTQIVREILGTRLSSSAQYQFSSRGMTVRVSTDSTLPALSRRVSLKQVR